ncbi:DUF5011 domain-containing protein [Enterococcus sp. DIV0242_7C1]|uniref:Pesticidal crystal protein Cry22Aa Ig-like domain-containing protein n=1 Tax=Candidatus Enterococcus dunnyi TaxID=1834192 RepID=A0A200J011_9ENTE|nr:MULTISPECIES: immunoglobulin-like domain-containing protein [unclassified Enterococcus]MBO0470125.1 DUF5011 domain-containing protein [Enterococcus sp. DIV0242_7C1]OUZ30582.1 hypothetical protein A5889_002870 [Enterococcus sp. 9D6_DIV0238]
MKSKILKGSILVYTIFVLIATLVFFTLSDQRENFADTEKDQVTELEKLDLPSGTRYKTIEYGSDISIADIFDITAMQMQGLEIKIINFDSTRIGTTDVTVLFKKKEIFSQGSLVLTVVDNEHPIITAHDITIYMGQDFDPLSEVSARDNVDGDLSTKISVSGSVDTSYEGIYELEYTVLDSSNNTALKTIEVNVIANPANAKEESVSESEESIKSNEQLIDSEPVVQTNDTNESNPLTNQNSFDNQPNIMIINGTTISYQNGGQGAGQSIIDNDPNGSASTWGGVQIQSGDDNANTHFIGHNPGVFSILFNISGGQSIIVNDNNGKATTYIITNILHLDDFGKEVTTGIDYWNETIGTAGGERITLQTCISDTENLMVFASK